jgi:hypothetical protein
VAVQCLIFSQTLQHPFELSPLRRIFWIYSLPAHTRPRIFFLFLSDAI